MPVPANGLKNTLEDLFQEVLTRWEKGETWTRQDSELLRRSTEGLRRAQAGGKLRLAPHLAALNEAEDELRFVCKANPGLGERIAGIREYLMSCFPGPTRDEVYREGYQAGFDAARTKLVVAAELLTHEFMEED